MTATAGNRRRFFRIDDRVRLSYHRRDFSEGLETLHTDHIVHPAALQLQQLDLELNTLLNTLWQDHPVAAQAIGLINRKIHLISSEIELNPGPHKPDDSREIDVNISGCGLAFNCSDMFGIGDLLELQITLLPSEATLYMLSRVSGFECNQNGIPLPHRVRTEFIGQDSEAHEALIQHLVQRQSALISARRESQEATREA